MATMAIVEFFVKPEKTEEFLEMMKGVLPDTRAFAGAQHLDTYLNQDEPGHVVMVEQWDARADHEKYMQWRMETGILDVLGPYVTARPKISYFDARPEV